MDTLVKQFSIIHRHTGMLLDKRLRKLDIPRGLYMYVQCVCEHEGSSQEQLASLMKIDKGWVARALHKLELQGFLYRVTSADDRRQLQVYPTTKAREVYPHILATIGECEAVLTAGLSPDETQTLRGLLARVMSEVVKG